MDRELALELVRVTEKAAVASGRWMGLGMKNEADGAAVDAMRKAFDNVAVSGLVVIGEGEMDEAPMLYIGEEVGLGGPEIDIAVDPVEGTNLIAKGLPGSIAVMAIAPRGCLLNAPDMYMEKLCVGHRGKGRIDIAAPVRQNVLRVADAMNRDVKDMVVVILDRERHEGIIREVRDTGARVKLISDGDVSPAVSVGIEGSGVHMLIGTGGAPEGVIAAAALKCLGGDMQARLWPENDDDIERAKKMGITDVKRILTIDDMVKGDEAFFVGTAITQCDFLEPVRYFKGGARTNSVVMRASTGTVRFIDAIHRFNAQAVSVRFK